MACPSCGSEEWKSASMVHLEGISTISSRSRARGVAVGTSGIGIGIGGARTSGQHQSVLSKLATPPKRHLAVSIILAIVFAFFGLAAFNSETPWFNIAIVTLSAIGLSFAFPRAMRKYRTDMALYAVTRVCQRCGQFYRMAPEAEGIQQSQEEHNGSARIFVFFVLLLTVGIAAFVLVHKTQPQSESRHTAQSVPMESSPSPSPNVSKEDLNLYYAVYRENDVKYLRTLFDDYLNGVAAEPQSDREAEFSLLEKWDKAYYRSKFVVLLFSKGELGGSVFRILFVDQPDRVFNVWVYPTSDGGHELRTFESVDLTEQQMNEIRASSQRFLDDRQHSM